MNKDNATFNTWLDKLLYIDPKGRIKDKLFGRDIDSELDEHDRERLQEHYCNGLTPEETYKKILKKRPRTPLKPMRTDWIV